MSKNKLDQDKHFTTNKATNEAKNEQQIEKLMLVISLLNFNSNFYLQFSLTKTINYENNWLLHVLKIYPEYFVRTINVLQCKWCISD